MKNTKKAKGAGKTKSTAVAAVIFGSVLALGGTTVAAPAAPPISYLRPLQPDREANRFRDASLCSKLAC